jgi:hypothetical protein
MTTEKTRPLTASEIREILRRPDDDLVGAILALQATREDLLEANTWLSADDDLRRERHEALHGKVAAILELLDARITEEPER